MTLPCRGRLSSDDGHKCFGTDTNFRAEVRVGVRLVFQLCCEGPLEVVRRKGVIQVTVDQRADMHRSSRKVFNMIKVRVCTLNHAKTGSESRPRKLRSRSLARPKCTFGSFLGQTVTVISCIASVSPMW